MNSFDFRAAALGGAVVMAGCLMAGFSTPAAASVVLFTDETAYDAANTTNTFTDFEGIVASGSAFSAPDLTVDGVLYDAPTGTSIDIGICSAGVCGGGGTIFPSSFLITNYGDPLDIFTTGLGYGVTALGGIFGDSTLPAGGTAATLSVFGTGDALLGSFAITVGQMEAGLPKTFFGVATDNGDLITRVRYDMFHT